VDGRDVPGSVKAWGLGFAVVSSVCFGSSGAFAKAMINGGFSPMQAVWLRVAGAALVLVPIVIALRGAAAFGAVRRSLPQLALFGAVGVAGCQGFYFVSASRLPVGVAILLEYTGPVLVVGWIRLVRRVPVPRSAAVGVAVALAGVACVVQIWAGLRLDGIGILAGFGAAASQATYFLLAEKMTGDTDPLVLMGAGFVIGTAALSLVTAPWSIPWRLLPADVAFAGGQAPAWLIAGWIIVVSTVAAFVTSVLAVQRLAAPVAAAVSYPEAVVAALFAWLVLGERLTGPQIAGGVIVLAGAFIAQRAPTARQPLVVSAEIPVAAPTPAR
jgi:drug/metabolite transporter (DMT)-like permease